MLALMLSGVIGLASLVFFGSAFFAPKLHRKDDFLWSGFGFFYALVLWICAQRFTGAILLGQLAGVCLILAFAWQTLRLRATIANQGIADIASFSLLDWVGGGLKRQPKAPKVQPTPKTSTPAIATEEAVEEIKEIEKTEETVAEKAIEKVDQVLESIDAPTAVVEAVEEIVQEAIAETEAKIETEVDVTEALPDSSPPEISPSPVPPTPPKGSISEKPKTKTTKNAPPSGSVGDRPKPKSKLFQWLFGGKKQPKPAQPANIAAVIEAVDEDWGEEEVQVVTTVEEVVEVVVPEQESIEALTTETEAVVEEAVEESVAVVEEAVAETLQPTENAIDAAIALESEPTIEVANPAEMGEIAAESPEVTEVIESDHQPDPSPEPEPLVVAETVNADNTELENPASETEKTADLPVIPVTTVMVEDSNWDDFDQEFDPYFGGDDDSTKLENQVTADHGAQSETEETSDTLTAETDPKSVDPA